MNNNSNELENIIKRFRVIGVDKNEDLMDSVELEEKVNEIYQELVDNYGIDSFMEEEAAKKKIRELNCNKVALIDWMENNVLNGE